MVIAWPEMFDTDHVSSADVPDSALDFLKPQFRGKAVTPYPADDDATLWLFHHVVQKYGWDWMDKYMLNKPNFIQGHLGQQRSVACGENTVAIDSIFNITEPMKREGKPVASHFSTMDATPIWPLTGAIFKKAPHRTQGGCSCGGCSNRSSKPPPAPGPCGATLRRRPATNRSSPTKW